MSKSNLSDESERVRQITKRGYPVSMSVAPLEVLRGARSGLKVLPAVLHNLD
jgi:hypothetical protein